MKSRSTAIWGITAATIAMILLFGGLILFANRQSGEVVRYTIPAGTQEQLKLGKEPPGMPPYRLNVRVGDTLEITNLDSVAHTYGFMVMPPGETSRYTFRRAGEFRGACTIALHDAVIITVT